MESHPFKDYSDFCQLLNEISEKFRNWTLSERTFALYYLTGGLPFTNAKFLVNSIDSCIQTILTTDVLLLEKNANDANFVLSLQWDSPQISLPKLVTHLPLLRPNNRDAAECYLNIISKIMHDSMTNASQLNALDMSELLNYVLIHPAFNNDEKKSIKLLCKQMASRCDGSESSESVSPNEGFARMARRSNSLTPAQTSDSHESLGYGSGIWSSQENLSVIQKPRSYSLSSDHPAAPQGLGVTSQLTLSSSDTKLHDMSPQSQPISKGIIFWLKSLRLHKYGWIFTNLAYDQMMELTEEQLEAAGITKGARHKLLINIAKLKERSQNLTTLESDVMNGGDLLQALRKLKTLIHTPMRSSSESLAKGDDDLPTQFVKVLGKVCTQLLMLRQTPEECISLFIWLCDRAEVLESFNEEQRRRLSMWKQQINNAHHYSSSSTTSNTINPHHSNYNLHRNRQYNCSNNPSLYHPSQQTPYNATTQQLTSQQLMPQQNPTNLMPPPPSPAQIQQLTVNYNNQKSSSYPNMNSVKHQQQRMSVGNIGCSTTPFQTNVFNEPPSTSSACKNLPQICIQQPPVVPPMLQSIFQLAQQIQSGNRIFNYDFVGGGTLADQTTNTTKTTSTTNNTDSCSISNLVSNKKNSEIENSLENLCLQMTEKALGP